MMTKRAFLASVAALGVAKIATTGPRLRATATSANPKPMTERYYADGIINPDGVNPGETTKGFWSPTKEWMALFSLSREETTVTATFYFENIPPRQTKQKLPVRASSCIVVHEIPEAVPPKMLYGVRIRSEVPIIVQPSRSGYEPNNPVAHAMASFVAYPGPLGQKETKWAYADGPVLHSESPLEEWEWITMLNPNPSKDARVKVTFDFLGEQRAHELTVPAERVRTVDMFNLPVMPKNKLSGPVIGSDVPVVVEQVRRVYAKGVPVITAMWAYLAYPIGHTEID